MKLKLIYLVVFLIVSSGFVCASLSDGLVSYWKLDEISGSVLDAHDSNDGTNHGATPNVTGKINTAYEFDGVDDYVEVADDDSLDFGTDNFSIGFWIKANIQDAMVIGKEYGDPQPGKDYVGWKVQIENDVASGKGIRFDMGDGNGNYIQALGAGHESPHSTDAIDGSWHHVAFVTKRDTNVILYVDGVYKNTSADISSIGSISNSQDLKIGERGDGWGNLNGSIDEVGIWNRSLNSTEISDLYNSGYGVAYPFIATCSPPSSGDWIINSTCIVNNTNYLVKGNLVVGSNGFLKLNSSTIFFQGENRFIKVQKSGDISLYNNSGFKRMPEGCADSEYVDQIFSSTLVGCNGTTTFDDASSLCASGWRPVILDENEAARNILRTTASNNGYRWLSKSDNNTCPLTGLNDHCKAFVCNGDCSGGNCPCTSGADNNCWGIQHGPSTQNYEMIWVDGYEVGWGYETSGTSGSSSSYIWVEHGGLGRMSSPAEELDGVVCEKI